MAHLRSGAITQRIQTSCKVNQGKGVPVIIFRSLRSSALLCNPSSPPLVTELKVTSIHILHVASVDSPSYGSKERLQDASVVHARSHHERQMPLDKLKVGQGSRDTQGQPLLRARDRRTHAMLPIEDTSECKNLGRLAIHYARWDGGRVRRRLTLFITNV